MTDTDELERRIERIEDELGIGNGDLPTFKEYQMVEKVADIQHLTVWRDEDGDAWIEDSDGVANCFHGTSNGQDLIDALEEANR